MRPVDAPEDVRVEMRLQLVQRPAARGAVQCTGHHGDGVVHQRCEHDFLRLHQHEPLACLHGDRLPASAALHDQVRDPFELVRPQRRASLPGLPRRGNQFPYPRDRAGEARGLDRLQQVVDGVHLERFYRMLIVRGHEDHTRRVVPVHQLAGHLETGAAGHLDVEQHEIRVQRVDDLEGPQAVSRLPDDLHVLELLELEAELVSREPFIVDHHGAYAHLRRTPSAARSMPGSRCARTFLPPACSPGATDSFPRI